MDFGEILKLWEAETRGGVDPRRGPGQASQAQKPKRLKQPELSNRSGSPKRPSPGDAKAEGDREDGSADGAILAPSAVAKAQADWLERYGVPDPSMRNQNDEPLRHRTKREIDAMPIDASIDLHGMTAMEAGVALSSFFSTAERGRCEKVLIVHGKGLHSKSEPVLAAFVRRWLEGHPSAGRSGPADAAYGGRGATWVLIKAIEDQRSR